MEPGIVLMLHEGASAVLSSVVGWLALVVVLLWAAAALLLRWEATRDKTLKILGILAAPLRPVVEQWAEEAARRTAEEESEATRRAIVDSVLNSIEANIEALELMQNCIMAGEPDAFYPSLSFSTWRTSSENFMRVCRSPAIREQVPRFYERLESIEEIAGQLAKWEGSRSITDPESRQEKEDRLTRLAGGTIRLGNQILESARD